MTGNVQLYLTAAKPRSLLGLPRMAGPLGGFADAVKPPRPPPLAL
jgi:hypothetical protein